MANSSPQVRSSLEGANAALAPTLDRRVTPQAESASDLALVAVPGTIPAPLKSWDRYEIVKPLGQGGMGTVFLARDARLERLVALKFLRLPSPDAAERMLQEARAQARLDHNGICKVFEVGEFQSQPYIAMEYIDGQPLHLALRTLTLEQKVLLLQQVALAVHQAHTHGILHRDLKPANIMVCRASAEASGERPDGLRPVLMDFGLARDSLGPQRLTQTGVILGTPHYMAPEQARGQARHLDRRADVYSLGAILYEMLTGKPPFDAETEVELLLAVLNQDPLPPRLHEPSLPVDLEVIALKCLRKEPEGRYDSALALAEDLERYLKSEPIVARPASTLYRLRRLAMRHRAFVAVGFVVFLSLCGALAFMLHASAKERAYAEHAHARQKLAAELGQASTRMNLFLRVAYSLPVHDLGREQAYVRKHINALQARMIGTDPFLHGTLESALGEGYLALREYEQAVAHLERAVKLGDTTPSVHLALGQSYGRLFEQRAAEIQRRLDLDQAKQKIEELRKELLLPALRELEAGEQTDLSSPAYIQALRHYYKGEAGFDEALKYARQAKQDAPWLIEPLDLELKIITQRYMDTLKRGNRPSDEETKTVHDTITQAISIARSYPEFYSSLADYSIIRIRSTMWMEVPTKEVVPIFEEGIRYGSAAVELEPMRGDAYDQLADIYAYWAYLSAWRNTDPSLTIKDGLAVVEKALGHSPARLRTYLVRGRMHLSQSMYNEFAGEDPLPSVMLAVEDARHATKLDPNSYDAVSLLGINLSHLVAEREWKSLPVEKEDDELMAVSQHGVELRSDIPMPRNNLAVQYIERAGYYINHGRDPLADLDKADKLFAEIGKEFPSFSFMPINMLSVDMTRLRYGIEKGADMVAQAEALIQKSQALRAKFPTMKDGSHLVRESNLLRIEALLRKGESPLPAIEEAKKIADTLDVAVVGKTQLLAFRIKLELKKAEWLKRSNQSPEPAVRSALALSLQVEAPKGQQGLMLLMMRAQALRLRAEWQKKSGQAQAAALAIEAGLAVCAEARKNSSGGKFHIDPQEGALLAIKAELLIGKNKEEGTRLATQATKALEAVIKDRPPLGRDFLPYLETAKRLAEAAKTPA